MASPQSSIDLGKISDGLSLSELDRGFYLDHSLSASTLSVDKSTSTICFPKDIVVEFADTSNSNLKYLATSPSVLCPLQAHQSTPLPHVHTLELPYPVQGKSSTPTECVLLKRPVRTSSLNLSSVDLTTTNPSWEVSFIKPALDSPKLAVESTELELTWSPRNQSGQPAVAEISSLMCSGTPPATTLSDEQRSWKETLPLEAVQEEAQHNLMS